MFYLFILFSYGAVTKIRLDFSHTYLLKEEISLFFYCRVTRVIQAKLKGLKNFITLLLFDKARIITRKEEQKPKHN